MLPAGRRYFTGDLDQRVLQGPAKVRGKIVCFGECRARAVNIERFRVDRRPGRLRRATIKMELALKLLAMLFQDIMRRRAIPIGKTTQQHIKPLFEIYRGWTMKPQSHLVSGKKQVDPD